MILKKTEETKNLFNPAANQTLAQAKRFSSRSAYGWYLEDDNGDEITSWRLFTWRGKKKDR